MGQSTLDIRDKVYFDLLERRMFIYFPSGEIFPRSHEGALDIDRHRIT